MRAYEADVNGSQCCIIVKVLSLHTIKVLAVKGSPHPKDCTDRVLMEIPIVSSTSKREPHSQVFIVRVKPNNPRQRYEYVLMSNHTQ